MATLGLLPASGAPHPHSLAPRPARQCVDECRRRDRCRAAMGLPTRLDCRQQLQCGQRCRSFSLACAAGAQDVCAVTHLKSRWRVYRSLSVLSPSHWRRSSGQIRCSSYSSAWKRSAPSASASVDSGGTQTIEQVWEEYFADASQWWDNRVDKKNPRSPDFKHKVTRTALWIDGWSTPAWVKARLTTVTQGKLQCHAGYDTRDSQDTAQGKRLPMGNNGEGNTLPTRARESRQIVEGGGGSMHGQSASTTSEAIAMLKNRLQQGIPINSYMYVDVLKRCSKQKDLLAVKQVHDCIIKSGMDQNTYVGTRLVGVYIRCGRLQDARRVFDGLLKKDVFSWTVMIGGYAQRNHAKDAMKVFRQMRQENVEADEITYLSILKACARPSALKWGKEVHAYIREGGLESDVRVGTALLQMYAKCGCIKEARQAFDNLTHRTVFSRNVMIGAYVESGSIDDARLVFDRMAERDVVTWNVMIGAYVDSGSIDDARLVFDRMEERDVITWNVMIGAYAGSGCGVEAYRLFVQMKREGFEPNAITFLSILNACASAGALEWVKEVHGHAQEAGLESDVRVGSALVHMYAKSGSVDAARLVFDRMVERNVVTWNVMIGAYAGSGCGVEAYRLFVQMKREGFEPNAVTFLSILNACASAGALEWVRVVHGHAQEAGLESDVRVGSALVHMYARSGSIDDARLVFDRMEERDVITWTAMIGGLAQYGCGEEAYRLFVQMKREGFVPNAITFLSVLNACASAGALERVREVHGHAQEAGLESDVRVGTALVHMYSKSGSMDDARLVFDRMEERNVITWTAMIGGLAQHGCGEEAYRLFVQMKREGFEPNAITFLSILNACASAGALEWVKEVHGHAQEGGLESDVRVGSALVHMYAKSGSVDDARLVFDRMEERNVITWNVMIGAFAESGCVEDAYRLYVQMKRDGSEPNAITFLSVLNACASAGALEWAKEVHGHAQEAGLELDVRVCSALVHLYAKSGSVDDARLVFDRLEERDLITWNVMIGAYAESGCGEEAYQLYVQMKREGFNPDAYTYVGILNACASGGALEWVKEVHAHAQEAGLESDVRVGSALVHMYAKSGSMDDARLVFDRMDERDVITWNVMIGAYAESGFGEEAFRLYVQMKREGFNPDSFTYVGILNACASAGALEWVKEVHGHAQAAGLESDVRVGSALVHMYAKSCSVDDARLVFDRMKERNVITWNVMIGAYAESGCGEEAYRLFVQMKREGFNPDAFTYIGILNACASAGALEWVKEVHAHAQAAGLESGVRVGSALVHMYGKSGSVDDARLVFDRMEERDVITWNVMIGAYAESGCGEDAYRLYVQMKREGLAPNAITFLSILNACASAGALEWVKEVHGHAQEAGLESEVRVGSALVHMYAKSGNMDDARLVFDRMEERNVITWTAMIGGLAQHGCALEALELFRRMTSMGCNPDECSFLAVLTACSHAGLVDDGRRLFLAMTRDFGVKADIFVCNCMVDLLGRAGQLVEAMLFIGSMPVEADGATWGALLGACRTYGNVELAEVAAKERLKLDRSDASTYVLLSNIYAAAGKWDQVAVVRTMMQKRGIRKEPGRSWIEVDNKIHRFVVGDTSHPETKEIYAELKSLTERIKAEGYIPDTRLVLRNVDEEDKELALCSHSEKLAIAYGLMRTPDGKPLRVFKNLRICSDCHTATKFISKVTGREIVARDANRFHHFNGGVCSCGDYW